jgi:hypothetical protein
MGTAEGKMLIFFQKGVLQVGIFHKDQNIACVDGYNITGTKTGFPFPKSIIFWYHVTSKA